MRIFTPKESHPGERRIALVPETAARLVKLGAQVEFEPGLGAAIGFADETFIQAGAIAGSGENADLVLRVRPPQLDEIARLQHGAIHLGYLDPFNQPQLIRTLADAGVTAISIEMLPRSTLAQKMDALSSQANLGGYVAVILAASRIDRIFPMMMTPAGTIKPLRVFVIGVGVAGLQAIATARRLGARVEAFDTRPVVEEQVRSLGAKFVKADLGETGQTAQGYAQALTPEQLERQREVMAQHCATADVVITTAQIFGKKAPVIVTTDMVKKMRPGSVIVDMAVESGGNVEPSRLEEEVEIGGVHILGFANLPARAAANASEMYAANLASFIEHFWDKETKTLRLNMDDEILQSCVITHGGKIVHETITALETPKPNFENTK